MRREASAAQGTRASREFTNAAVASSSNSSACRPSTARSIADERGLQANKGEQMESESGGRNEEGLSDGKNGE